MKNERFDTNEIDQYVKQLYRNLLHREAEPDGLVHWANLIKKTGDLNSVFNGIISSEEYKILQRKPLSSQYYAEFETDRIIREKYFPDFTYRGIMVEVGAATPVFLSMSKHFKDTGWRCICIEPNPKYVEMHKKVQNEVYQFACSNTDQDNIDFQVVSFSDQYDSYQITDHSYSSLKIKEHYLVHGNKTIDQLPIKTIKVNVRKLNTLLSELDIKLIDILSVDTEGWELEVMEGFDSNAYQPEIIVLENWTNSPDYTKYMKSIGYKMDQQIEHNFIYKKTNISYKPRLQYEKKT